MLASKVLTLFNCRWGKFYPRMLPDRSGPTSGAIIHFSTESRALMANASSSPLQPNGFLDRGALSRAEKTIT